MGSFFFDTVAYPKIDLNSIPHENEATTFAVTYVILGEF